MSEGEFCSKCGLYFCRSDDAFCSGCGAPRAKLGMELLPEALFVGERPPKICARLSNKSCADLQIGSLGLPAWLQGPPGRLPVISAGGQASILLSVKDLLRDEAVGTVTANTPAGSAAAELTVISRAPQIACEPQQIRLWRLDEACNQEEFELHLLRGALRILSIGTESSELTVAADIPPGGLVCDAARPLYAKISLQSAADAGQFSVIEKNVSTRLIVAYQSPHGPMTAEVPIDISRCKPPQLYWPQELKRPELRYQTSGQMLRFVICNQSANDNGLQNGPLVILDAELKARAVPEAKIRRATHFPVAVDGGGSMSVEFETDFSALRGQAEKLVYLKLKVATNLTTREWTVPLKIAPMPEFGGVVAIDFGSSNSCCAVWQEGSVPELVQVDDRTNFVAPTVVRYRRLTPPPEIETGARPKELAAQYAYIAASTADRLKQRLGDQGPLVSIRPEEDAKWVERRITDVAADYLRNIRRKAELAKQARFRDFVLTHPARCSLRQYRHLRSALRAAFDAGNDEIRIQFLPEPVAALIDYIVQRQKAPGEHSDYVVASFDLGGGTTDVSIVKVTQKSGKKCHTRIVPDVLYSCGDRFGGEDLTDFLQAELASRVSQHIASDAFKGANNISGSVTPVLPIEDVLGTANETVRLNRNVLRQIAEVFKVSLSSEQAKLPEMFVVHLDVGAQTGAYSIRLADVRGLGGKDLELAFNDYARIEIAKRIEMLTRAIAITGSTPSVIQLSGKTSYLPVVHTVLAEAFGGIEIERAPDPKECVAKGACLMRAMRRGVAIEFDLDTPVLTSTIGAYALSSSYFQPILKVGEKVPAEGLQKVLPQAWDGRNPVVLWEDLNGAEEDVPDYAAAEKLSRLGVWAPESWQNVSADSVWDIRISLRNFELEVAAVGPDDELVSMRQL